MLAHAWARSVSRDASERAALARGLAEARAAALGAVERLSSAVCAALADPTTDAAAGGRESEAAAAARACTEAIQAALASPPRPDDDARGSPPAAHANPFTLRQGVAARRVCGMLRASWLQEYAVLTTDRVLHLFSATPAEVSTPHTGGLPSRPVLTISLGGGGDLARAWTPSDDSANGDRRAAADGSCDDAAGSPTAVTTWFTPSSRVLIALPASQRLWDRIGGGRLLGGSPAGREHEIDFGSALEAAEWLRALNGDDASAGAMSEAGGDASPRVSLA